MRALLRNRELRQETIGYLAIVVLFAIAGAVWHPTAGLLLLLLGAALTALHLYQAARRYRAMEQLASEIDAILFGQRTALIAESAEGELSILQSEIRKLTVRMQEQTAQAQEDKKKLAQAMEDIFHQFRTPLTALTLQTALLAEEDLTVEKRLAHTRVVRRQLQRMEWLTESLLKMSKIDAGTVTFRQEKVAVSDLVRRASDPLAIPMELRGQTLQLQLSDASLHTDPAWTTEAIGNLLKNCMEHTPAGGTVSVRCTDNALYTELTVQDTGEGFLPEDIPHLFERFYRGKNAAPESVGIGLALARSIVSEQGGTLTAENAPEGGARFVLRFYKSVI